MFATLALNRVRSNCSMASLNPPPSLCPVPGRERAADPGMSSSSFAGLTFYAPPCTMPLNLASRLSRLRVVPWKLIMSRLRPEAGARPRPLLAHSLPETVTLRRFPAQRWSLPAETSVWGGRTSIFVTLFFNGTLCG